MSPIARRVVLLAWLALLPLCAACVRIDATVGPSGHGRSAVAVPTTTAPESAGLQFGHPVPVTSGTPLVAVSCGSASSCTALDGTGQAYRFDGSTWTGPTPIGNAAPGPGAAAVSCAGPATCVADPEGGDQVWTWDGGAWSSPVTLPAAGIEALGCAPTGYCAAVDALGDAFALDGGAWTATAGDWGSVTSVSCASASFCVSASGGLSQWTGQRWSEPQTLGVTSPFTGVSCPTPSFCMAVAAGGEAVQWNGTSWSPPGSVASGAAVAAGGQLDGVSCPTATWCLAVDSSGRAMAWRGGTWTSDDVDGTQALSAVSCPSVARCVLVDRHGNAIVTDTGSLHPARAR